MDTELLKRAAELAKTNPKAAYDLVEAASFNRFGSVGDFYQQFGSMVGEIVQARLKAENPKWVVDYDNSDYMLLGFSLNISEQGHFLEPVATALVSVRNMGKVSAIIHPYASGSGPKRVFDAKAKTTKVATWIVKTFLDNFAV